ncbi:MAG: hypothetical protein AUH84_05355 [Thaumarchaeota archaeon 13_1_40CM_4_38_7]|nr:MAG: hypothetical protein AUH84_05355 [Thaumarchaeota archaeon 13_1_40CM_4_38_7]
MFGKHILLKKTSVRQFTPMTANDNVPARKTELLEKLKKEIPDLKKVQEKCKGAQFFSVDICFYLNKSPQASGESEKDLDNMLKPLLDVLAEKFTNSDNKPVDGLGLIGNDKLIHEIHCVKKHVDKENTGFDIEISKWQDEK